jgi:hypothetical protein
MNCWAIASTTPTAPPPATVRGCSAVAPNDYSPPLGRV